MKVRTFSCVLLAAVLASAAQIGALEARPLPPPDPPVLQLNNFVPPDSVVLSWAEVAGARSYRVRRTFPFPTDWSTQTVRYKEFHLADPDGRLQKFEAVSCRLANGNNCSTEARFEWAVWPPTPAGLRVSDITDSSIALHWTVQPASVDSVLEVGYSTDTSSRTPTVLGANILGRTETSHTFTGLTASSPYRLFVRAKVYDSTGTRLLTASGWAHVDATTSSARLSHFRATPGDNPHNAILLHWDRAPSAGSFQARVRQGHDAWGPWSERFNGASRTIGSLAYGRRYDVQVRVCGRQLSDSCGPPSGLQTATKPGRPGGLAASDIADTGVTLRWGALSGNNESVLQVGYSADASATAPDAGTVVQKARTDTSHAFTGLMTTYRYRLFVRAVVMDSATGARVLAAGDWAHVDASTTGLAPPANLQVRLRPYSVNSLLLTWDAVPGASAYWARRTSPWPTEWSTGDAREVSFALGNAAGQRQLPPEADLSRQWP